MGEPVSQSIDQMFAEDNEPLDTRYGITRSVNIGSFSSGFFGAESSKAIQTGQEPIDANSDVHAQPTQSVNRTTISGKWSMELNFSVPPKASLTLFQNGDAI
jgi:hypothetical protein